MNLAAKPINYPDKIYYNSVMKLRELGTGKPINELFVK